MSGEEAKKTVAAGLEQRRNARNEREAKLDRVEQNMISACNKHCADAKKQRLEDDTIRLDLEQKEARAAARREARAVEAAKEMASQKAIRMYGLACLVILLVSAWTKLPLWAAATLAFGLAVFPAVYIFRLYVPLEK